MSAYSSDDYNDLEFGCSAYSRTTENSVGFVGGVVIAVDRVAEKVDTLGNFAPHSSSPSRRTIPFADIDMSVVQWDTRNAGAAASQLFTWLAQHTRKRGGKRKLADWAKVAADLQAVYESGMSLRTPT